MPERTNKNCLYQNKKYRTKTTFLELDVKISLRVNANCSRQKLFYADARLIYLIFNWR